MIKIAIIGLMAVLLAIPLRKDKPEFSMLVILCGCIIILGFSLEKIQTIIETMEKIQRFMGSSSMYISLIIKIIGITYIAEISSNICRDAGYSAVGSQIDFFGKLMIIAVSMPIFEALIDCIAGDY